MPEVSRFYGIIVKMYFNDHAPPHFHAFYGEHEALVSITTLAVIAGRLPPRAMGARDRMGRPLRQNELLVAWERARNQESPGKVEPLS